MGVVCMCIVYVCEHHMRIAKENGSLDFLSLACSDTQRLQALLKLNVHVRSYSICTFVCAFRQSTTTSIKRLMQLMSRTGLFHLVGLLCCSKVQIKDGPAASQDTDILLNLSSYAITVIPLLQNCTLQSYHWSRAGLGLTSTSQPALTILSHHRPHFRGRGDCSDMGVARGGAGLGVPARQLGWTRVPHAYGERCLSMPYYIMP